MVGTVNVVAPEPVTNADFTATLARVLGRPTLGIVPELAVDLLFGEMGRATLLASQRVHPRRLIDAGFEFAHPTLEQALRAELGAQRS
jgi:NAD dependent epimerase/dehydratase family enzyme